MAANDDILSDTFLRDVRVDLYRNDLVAILTEDFDRTFAAVVARIVREDLEAYETGRVGRGGSVTSRAEATASRAYSAAAAAMGAALPLLETELVQFGELEARWQGSIISRRLPVILGGPSAIDLNVIRRMILSQPFNGDILRGWFTQLPRTMQRDLYRQLTIGLTNGESIDEIVRRVRGSRQLRFRDGVIAKSRRQAEAIVRTAVTHATVAARQHSFEQNSEVIKGVQWVSTLDARTSDICMGLDGEIFPIDSGPRPPAHFNCRSTVVPVLKSWKELGLNYAEVPETTRASLNGQVAARTTYPEWLRSQPFSVQVEALGRTRAQWFREGRLDLKNLVDSQGRRLTLADLRRLENIGD